LGRAAERVKSEKVRVNVLYYEASYISYMWLISRGPLPSSNVTVEFEAIGRKPTFVNGGL